MIMFGLIDALHSLGQNFGVIIPMCSFSVFNARPHSDEKKIGTHKQTKNSWQKKVGSLDFVTVVGHNSYPAV